MHCKHKLFKLEVDSMNKIKKISLCIIDQKKILPKGKVILDRNIDVRTCIRITLPSESL